MTLAAPTSDCLGRLAVQVDDPRQLVCAACDMICHTAEHVRHKRGWFIPLLDALEIVQAARDWLRDSSTLHASAEKAREHATWSPSSTSSMGPETAHYCAAILLATMLEDLTAGKGNLAETLVSVAADCRRAGEYVESFDDSICPEEGDWQIAYLESLLATNGHSYNPEMQVAQ